MDFNFTKESISFFFPKDDIHPTLLITNIGYYRTQIKARISEFIFLLQLGKCEKIGKLVQNEKIGKLVQNETLVFFWHQSNIKTWTSEPRPSTFTFKVRPLNDQIKHHPPPKDLDSKTLIQSKLGIFIIFRNNLNEIWDFYHNANVGVVHPRHCLLT